MRTRTVARAVFAMSVACTKIGVLSTSAYVGV